jgi:hypothetical protein
MPTILQVIYASAATREWTPEELLHLLHGARQRNTALGITGLLGYNTGTFLQLLEGPPARVRGLLRRIEKDPRHGELTVLLERVVQTRFFPDWSMGFQQIREVIPGPGLSLYLPQAGSVAMWIEQPDAALGFFELCRATASETESPETFV